MPYRGGAIHRALSVLLNRAFNHFTREMILAGNLCYFLLFSGEMAAIGGYPEGLPWSDSAEVSRLQVRRSKSRRP